MSSSTKKLSIFEVTGWLTFLAFIAGSFFSIGQTIILGGAYLSTFSYSDFVRNAIFSIGPLLAVLILTMMSEVWLYSPFKSYIESVTNWKADNLRDKFILFVRPLGSILIPYSIVFPFVLTRVLGMSLWWWLIAPICILITFLLLRLSRKALFRAQKNNNSVKIKPFDNYLYSNSGIGLIAGIVLLLNLVGGYWFVKVQDYYTYNARYSLVGSPDLISAHYVTSNSKTIVFAGEDAFILMPRSQISSFEKKSMFLKSKPSKSE